MYSGSIGTSESVVKRALRSARFFTAGPYASSSKRCFARLALLQRHAATSERAITMRCTSLVPS